MIPFVEKYLPNTNKQKKKLTHVLFLQTHAKCCQMQIVNRNAVIHASSQNSKIRIADNNYSERKWKIHVETITENSKCSSGSK
jgi:hypothetical protein